jgi:hypothetical protein
VSFDEFRFGVFVRGFVVAVFVRGFVVAVFVMLFFVVPLFVEFVFRMVVHDVLRIAESGSVFGAFMGGVGFEFGAIRGAMLFDFLGFVLGEFRLCGGLVFRRVELGFLFRFFLGFFFR